QLLIIRLDVSGGSIELLSPRWSGTAQDEGHHDRDPGHRQAQANLEVIHCGYSIGSDGRLAVHRLRGLAGATPRALASTVDLGIESIPPKWTQPEATRGRGLRCAAKFFQARPSKTKQECLDLLGFIRPNRDFSMGCSDFQIRIFSPLSLRLGLTLSNWGKVPRFSDFCKQIDEESAFRIPRSASGGSGKMR